MNELKNARKKLEDKLGTSKAPKPTTEAKPQNKFTRVAI